MNNSHTQTITTFTRPRHTEGINVESLRNWDDANRKIEQLGRRRRENVTKSDRTPNVKLGKINESKSVEQYRVVVLLIKPEAYNPEREYMLLIKPIAFLTFSLTAPSSEG